MSLPGIDHEKKQRGVWGGVFGRPYRGAAGRADHRAANSSVLEWNGWRAGTADGGPQGRGLNVQKSVLVIGIGRFGKHLALRFAELGDEVMVVDQEEEPVNALAPYVTAAQIGDCKDELVLASLGVGNFDLCFVCISSDFQSSLEVTSLLKELGARHVVAKADRDIHTKFLLKCGADEVICPERDMARRAAVRYSAQNAFDYVELTPEYGISEIQTPEEWVGRSVRQLAVRTRYHLNIIAVKQNGRIEPLDSAEHVFHRDEHLIIAGRPLDSLQLAQEN